MSDLIIHDRSNNPINDWRDWTHPKKSSQWRSGRSAMELARSWFISPTPRCPDEVTALFATSDLLSDLRLSEGIPEYVTPLPERGEGRNHDLLLIGESQGRKVVVAVEAKADEQFGEVIGDYWTKKRTSKKPTRVPERIESLLKLVFGPEASPEKEPWKNLRYQLLTTVAGAVLEAKTRKTKFAVVVIHEFRTNITTSEKLMGNATDFADFVEILCGVSAQKVKAGQLYGPVTVRIDGDTRADVNVLIGKAIFDWNTA